MSLALNTAASGMRSQQMNIDNIANNMANVNTAGYKKSMMDFQDLVYQQLAQPGTTTAGDATLPTGMEIGLGSRSVSNHKLYTQGVPVETGNPLDLSINGDGFFQITMPDGTMAYTRDGAFKMDGQGNLVTSEGLKVDPAITIPSNVTSISVGIDGTISATVPGSTQPQEIGKLTVARFVNPAGLLSIGKNLTVETLASGSPVIGTPGTEGIGSLNSGFLEMSNVDVVKEMVDMIRAQRAYEINSRVVKGADEMMQTIANLKG